MLSNRQIASVLPVICALALFGRDAYSQQASEVNSHVLKPTPMTVAWGYYDATTPPALRIKSGDTVEVHTLITSTPPRLEGAGVKPDQIESSLREIFTTVTNKGPGGHILTGPVYIEGAEAGDVLEVRIQSIKLAIPYAYTAFRPGAGFLPEDFAHSKMKIIPLDEKRMMGLFGDGIEIPLRPFFGSMGVAPPEAYGRVSSAPPGIHAGNLDNKEFGEVCITALETSLIGKLQFIVRKDMKLRWPRAETPAAFMTMGINEDLTEATRIAVREMIDFLVTEKKLSRDDAYMLASVAADLSITQLVDGTKGVHAMIPKAIFQAGSIR